AMHKLKIGVLLYDKLETPAAAWPAAIQQAVTEKMKDKNISFFGRTAIQTILKKENHFVLKTEQAETIADIVFSVVGTKPATAFCGQKIEKLENGAILIDRNGQTSAKDVYAAGDCASVFHKIFNRQVYFPLGSTANKMGRIAGLNMVGTQVTFPGIVGTQILKFFELSMAKTGLNLEEAGKEGWEAEAFSATRPNKAEYYPGAEKTFVEIIKEKSTESIIGAAAVCSDNASQFIDPAAMAVFSRLKISELAWFDFAYAPPYAPVWNALISAALKAG
ncbi:MAG: FAD-dependent oxidoreductase, partial [Candidatus Aminicenantes bacterium]|nr:FAD-dependent oxidoreductase [Candidatus Aminicenantes bacterium]